MRALSTRSHYIVQSLDAKFLTASQICERFGVSLMWIVRRLKDSSFPQPIRFGNSKTSRRFWRIVDVEAWEHDLAEKSARSRSENVR
jgi:predicted DNA-binding transcriptional regulator AlpA